MARRVTRRSQSRFYRNSKVRVEYVASYATKLLENIRKHLNGVISFTRDDLQRLPIVEFEQVGFATRYSATLLAVRYLIDRGELIEKKSPDLCLPEREASYHFDETSASEEYEATIRRLVRGMPRDQVFAIMQVVQRWRTDPQLTADTKRKAVRNTMPRLVREGVCVKLSRFEFQLGGQP